MPPLTEKVVLQPLIAVGEEPMDGALPRRPERRSYARIQDAIEVPKLLCRFLVAVRLQGSQVHTHGAAFAPQQLARYEQAVLEGYADGKPLRLPELRCYQLLITLDKWSALVSSPSRSWSGRLQYASLTWAFRYLRSESRRLLQLIEAGA